MLTICTYVIIINDLPKKCNTVNLKNFTLIKVSCQTYPNDNELQKPSKNSYINVLKHTGGDLGVNQ